MEYPKTEAEALKNLQGSWKTQDGKVSFKIIGNNIVDIEGISTVLYLYFKLKPPTADQPLWQLVCPSFLWESAAIISWDENSFTIQDRATQSYPTNIRAANDENIIESTYIRV